jgi:hypothetical protein
MRIYGACQEHILRGGWCKGLLEGVGKRVVKISCSSGRDSASALASGARPAVVRGFVALPSAGFIAFPSLN